MMNIQLSVVIITYNEEKNIARCLDSVKGVADDIVVVDSFSTDITEAICLSKGARFVKRQFDGHIEQKNWAITQAKFPYVLSLDADEALSEELKAAIVKIKSNWTKDGYYMNRLNNYCGQWIRYGGWYPDRKLRLWDSRKGKWEGINPHDKFEMFEGDGVTAKLSGDILHYSYSSVEDHYKQAEKFSNISANAMFKQGQNISYSMLFIKSGFKFFRNYLLRFGFLDGKYGYVIAKINAYETYLKYSKLKQKGNEASYKSSQK